MKDKKQCKDCVICDVSLKLYSPQACEPGMQIGHHLHKDISIPNEEYLRKYVSKLSSDVEQFPIGKFHQQCDKIANNTLETDLMNDSFLTKALHKMNLGSPGEIFMSIKSRKASIEKQDSQNLFMSKNVLQTHEKTVT